MARTRIAQKSHKTADQKMEAARHPIGVHTRGDDVRRGTPDGRRKVRSHRKQTEEAYPFITTNSRGNLTGPKKKNHPSPGRQ